MLRLLFCHVNVVHDRCLGDPRTYLSWPTLQGLVSLAYSTVILCCVHVFKTLGIRTWRIFAVMSVPADLTIMGINLAKITILAYSGLPADCHGLTRDNCKPRCSVSYCHNHHVKVTCSFGWYRTDTSVRRWQ